MRVRIEGSDLPRRSCAPHDAPLSYANVHVGIQRRSEVIERFPGDADATR
jgi:hypothetical protein